MGLGGEVHEDAPVGLAGGRFDNRVEAFVPVDHDRRGVVRVEAKQRAVRSVRIKPDERDLAINQVLRGHAGDDRFADAALFAADEVN